MTSGSTIGMQMRSGAWWARIDPDMHVEGVRRRPPIDVSPALLATLGPDLRTDGYFQLDAVIPAEEVRSLLTLVLRLRQLGLPPVFAFVFDESWVLFDRLGALWTQALGPGWRALPAFFAWYVPADVEGAGWPPHRDRLGSIGLDGNPQSLSVWIPLTPALPTNGCMYVVPRRRGNFPMKEIDLQDVRALPAPSGSVLAWHQELVHWSARSSHRAPCPRVSVSMEFQRGDVAPFESPLLDPGRPPPLSLRLALIGRQLTKYQHMSPLGPELRDLALFLAADAP
jgi:hypothetical protein